MAFPEEKCQNPPRTGQFDQRNRNRQIYIDMEYNYLSTTPAVPGSTDNHNCLWRDPIGGHPRAVPTKASTRMNRRRRKALCRDLERLCRALAGVRPQLFATG